MSETEPMSLRTMLVAIVATGCLACGNGQAEQQRQGIRPSYDKDTGRLIQLDFDSDKNGRVDTWTKMSGSKPLQSQIDHNEDGRVDRWEYYSESGELAKVGFSRRDDGQVDAWAYPGEGQAVQKLEISSTGDEHRIDRWEYYDPSSSSTEAGALVRAEEDTNGDGKPDKWETFRAGAIETVAFDENRDGVPDRRLKYSEAVLVQIESEPDSSGRFMKRIDVK